MLLIAVASIRPVYAVVITQDCDAVRSPDISLCEIRKFYEVDKDMKDATSPKRWVKMITKHARINQKWFYLPPHVDIGFTDRMAVDFRTVIRIDREDIENMRRDHRVAKLNDTALSHFRERVGEFFRRYPYDEWYPLTKPELDEYTKGSPEPIKPYPWQN